MTGSTDLLVLALLSAHIVLFALAVRAVLRAEGYTTGQPTLQILIAFLLPVFGAPLVLRMARDSVEHFPGPEESKVDRQHRND